MVLFRFDQFGNAFVDAHHWIYISCSLRSAYVSHVVPVVFNDDYQEDVVMRDVTSIAMDRSVERLGPR